MEEKKFEFISEILEFTQNYKLKGAESMYKYGTILEFPCSTRKKLGFFKDSGASWREKWLEVFPGEGGTRQ